VSKKEVSKIEYGLILAVITTACGFAFGYGAINSKVEANTEKIKQTVNKSEFESIQKWQVRFEEMNDRRMTRFENKLDRLIERKQSK
jgi:Flp pilus assembly pilin Flp